MRCQRCGRRTIEIALSVGEAEDAVLVSCSSCEIRSWWRGDERLPLDEVLTALSAANPRQRPRRAGS